LETKICKVCGEEKPLSEFYSQNINSETKGIYVRYNTTCKTCYCERSKKWSLDNKERYTYLVKRRDDGKKDYLRNLSKERRLNGKHKEWARNNKDKVHQYNKNRSQNKTHNINMREWELCKTYFDNSCAYCGISEADAVMKTKNKLHKEHVKHDGSNDIDNCIPACKNCNSEKHTFTLDDWYNKDNIKFNRDRYNKITSWIDNDYKITQIK
jgi:hypothetical protein